jgi:hypothetical protein
LNAGAITVWFCAHWAELLYVLGMVFELLGAYVVASKVLQIKLLQIPGLLIASLVGTKGTAKTAELMDLLTENPNDTFRGLAFISIGFVLKLVSEISRLF